MSVAPVECRWERWPAWRLEDDRLRVVVVPALGGKVVDLTSVRSGRSWLWSNPHSPCSEAGTDACYVRDHDHGGWDEVLPTVHPCEAPGTPWGRATLADHGLLWSRPWHAAADSGALTLACDLAEVSARFSREMRLEAGLLTVTYCLRNHGRAPLPYVWAAHPLLAIEPGMQLELPPGTTTRCAAALGARPPRAGTDAGPITCQPLEAPGRAVKLFVDRFQDAPGWVRLVTADGSEALRTSFATADVPSVGLWINEGGWSGAGTAPYRNLGIEPTTSPHDTLTEAISDGTAAVAAPGSERRWALKVGLE